MSATASKVSKMLLTVGGTPTELGEVRSFSIETSLGTIDVSTLATDWKKYLVGQAGWSGSLECFYDPRMTHRLILSKARAGTLCTVTSASRSRCGQDTTFRHLLCNSMSISERQRTQLD